MKAKSRTISLEDGRKIRIIEAGQPDGIPILVHNGTPGSRLLYEPWIDDAESRGIRLISYERPGYGGSTRLSGRTVASAAADVVSIANELNIKRLSVWGISGGGPHALACAALLPNLVVAAAALASLAPCHANGLDWFAGMGEGNIEVFSTALESHQALEVFIEAVAPEMLGTSLTSFIQDFQSILSPVDTAVLTESIGEYLRNSTREGILERRDGWIDDTLAFTKAWGFKMEQIQVPVMLLHGAQDQVVPFSHGKWLASKIPNVTANILPEDGHLTLVSRRIPEVHAWLLDRM